MDWAAEATLFSHAQTREKIHMLEKLPSPITNVEHDPNYQMFLVHFLPKMLDALETTQPQFDALAQEHILRNHIIDVLHKLPMKKPLDACIAEIFRVVFRVIMLDNEVNASKCLNVLLTLYKSFKQESMVHVQPFFDFFKSLYGNFRSTAFTLFSGWNTKDQMNPNSLKRSVQSFKIMTECPYLIIVLYQLYPELVREFIPEIFWCIIKGCLQVSSSTERGRDIFLEYFQVQVKALAFIIYFIRNSPIEPLKSFQEDIASCTLSLLKQCPSDTNEIRKELLMTIRNLLGTEFRRGFFKKIDFLLDENVLFGSERYQSSFIRPLAYLTLSELIIHAREELQARQLSKIVLIFSKNVHDPSLPLGTQLISAQVILNLADTIFHSSETQKSYVLLAQILFCLTSKLKSIHAFICKSAQGNLMTNQSVKKVIEAEFHPARDMELSNFSLDSLKTFVYDIFWGLKTVIFFLVGISKSQNRSISYTLEADAISCLFRCGIEILELYELEFNSEEAHVTNAALQVKLKPPLSNFAEMFISVDSRILYDVLYKDFEFFMMRSLKFKKIPIEDILRPFLETDAIALTFSDVFLSYILVKLNSGCSLDHFQSILRVSEFAFVSLKASNKLEDALKPYVKEYSRLIIKNALNQENQDEYLRFLGIVYSSLFGLKCEMINDELFSILPELFYNLQALSKRGSVYIRVIAIELILNFPVRLSSLLPFAGLIVDAIINGLESDNSKLNSTALRTLDFWVENCDLEFLYPYCERHMAKFVRSLSRLLSSPIKDDQVTALRILGKLGGRNRLFFSNPHSFSFKSEPDEGLSLSLTFDDDFFQGKTFALPTSSLIRNALDAFRSSNTSASLKKTLFKLTTLVLPAIIRFDLHEWDGKTVVAEPSGEVISFSLEAEMNATRRKHQKIAEESVFLDVMQLLFEASVDHEISQEAKPFFETLISYMALILLFPCPKSIENEVKFLDENIFLKSLLSNLCDVDQKKFVFAKNCLQMLLDQFCIHIEPEKLRYVPSISYLFEELSHYCYSQSWNYKRGACNGLFILLERISLEWIQAHSVEILKSLLAVYRCDENSGFLQEVVQIGDCASKAFLTKILLSNVTQMSIDRDAIVVDRSLSFNIEYLETLISILATELISSAKAARHGALKLLQFVSEISSIPVLELIQKHRDKLLAPFSSRSGFVGVPLVSRIAYTSAVTVFLQLRDPGILSNPQLDEFISFIVKDVNESELPSQSASARKVFLHNFRIESLKFLTVALSVIDFNENDERSRNSRDNIVKALFNCLTSQNDDVVLTAKEALEKQEKPLPKEVLKECLRPILNSISDHKKLNVRLLKLLARLLEILSKCFSNALGTRLLSHVQTYIESFRQMQRSSALQPQQSHEMDVDQDSKESAGIFRKLGKEMHIPVALVELFPLLPILNNEFAASFVAAVLDLEEMIGSVSACGDFHSVSLEHSSPFRKPLFQFLQKYQSFTISFFTDTQSLLNPRLRSLFFALLSSSDGSDTLKSLSENPELLWPSNPPRNIRAEQLVELEYYVIKIFSMFCSSKFDAVWYSDYIKRLVQIFEFRTQQSPAAFEEFSSAEFIHLPELIVKIFMDFLQKKTDIDLIWSSLHCFVMTSLIDYSFLSNFFKRFVKTDLDIASRVALLEGLFVKYVDVNSKQQGRLVKCFQVVIIPLIESLIESENLHLLSDAVMSHFFNSILELRAADIFIDELHVQFIKYICLLVEHLPARVSFYSQKVFAYLLHLLQKNNYESKVHSYSVVAHCSKFLQPAIDVSMEVFKQLINNTDTESFPLFAESLELYFSYYENNPNLDHSIWITALRNRLDDESRNINRILHLWSVLSVHETALFGYSQLFLPLIVNALELLSISSIKTLRHKETFLQVAGMLLSWIEKLGVVSNLKLCNILYASLVQFSLAFSELFQKHPHLNEKNMQLLHKLMHIASTSIESPLFFCPDAVSSFQIGRTGFSDWCSRLLRIIHILNEFKIVSTSEHVLQLFQLLSELYFASNVPIIVHQILEVFEGFLRQNGSNNAFFNTLYERAFSIIASIRPQDYKILHVQLVLVCTLPCMKSLVQENFSNFIYFLKELSKTSEAAEAKNLLGSVNRGSNVAFECANASEINRIIYFEDYCGFILSNSKHKDLKLLILDHLKAFYTSNIKFVVIALKTFSTFLASQDFFSEEDDIYFGFAVDLIRTICIAKIESLANFDQIALIFYFGISCRGISKRAEFIQLLSLFERSYLRKMLLFVMAYLPSKTRVSKWASRSLFLLFSAVAKNACIKSIAGSAFLAHGFKEYSNFSPLNFRYRCKVILNMSLSSLMSEVSLKSSESFMSYLGEICTYMPQVSSEIWKNVFSYVWSLTGDVERRDVFEKLQKSLKSLSGECKYENFNGIQTLMGALSKCSHSEMFDPMLIVSLSSKFNCWFSGIDLLHEYLQMDPENARVANALRTLYNLINEEDIAVGLWNSVSFASPISQAALALEQFRLWQRSKEVLMKGLCRFSNDLGDDQKKLLDYQLFENEWIRCEKAVNSWETLLKFGLDVENPEMQFEAAVKLSKWDIVKENIPKICLNEYSSIETPCKIEIAKLYMHILERNSGSDDGCFDAKFEDLCNLCIEQWIKLPSCISAIHVPMLAFMQQLAELKESNQVLSILPHSSNSSNHRSSDLDFSNLISCWRERVPNTWEDLPIWIDVLGWRLDFFKNICERLNLDDTSPRYTQLHDIPWTIVKLAQVSRKQLLSGTSIDILGTVTDSKTLDSRDTYFKLRELIKVVSQLTTVSETRLALQIIQMINLDYFSNSQKAELFRLKGEALQILGFGDESHAAFSAATSMNDCDGKSWNSWGSFCDRVFSMRKETQWAEYAVSCYLQAVAYGNPRARLMLTRVLWLLSFDEPNGSVIKAFEKYSSKVPLWVWLLWLPQLLSSLGRNEGPQIQLLLAELLKLYPQVVYYSLRGYILEKSELNQAAAAAAASRTASNSAVGSQVGRTYVLTSSGINSTSYMQSRSQSVSMESSVDGATPNNPGVSKSDAKSGLKLAEELVKLIQSLFTSLTLEVSKMIDEITKKLKPDSEEDLLSAVSALFIRSFKQPVSSPDEVPKPTIQTLERVYTKFFSSSVPANTSDQKEFIMKYKNDFENDFLPSSSAFPAHLTELMRRLKKWKSRLQYSMKSKGRECLKLEKLSNYLSNFQSCDIEIPGQYFTDQEPSFNTGVLIHSFDSDVPVYRHHGFSSRRLAIRGNDGNLYYFFVHLSLQHLMRSEERMMQLHTIINRLLLKYNESQRRNLFMHVRKTIPLSHRLRLVQIDPTEVTMEEVYIHCCSKNGVDADAPLTMYRNHIGAAISWERNKIARLEVFEKILNRLLPPSAFSKYMSGTIPSLEEYWLFRKHFASQLALNSFLGYIMKVGDRLPYKISFSRSSGHIVFSEFYPSYNAAYLAELAEDVPFRLTPSITTFLSPQIVQGVFGTTLLALAACLLKHQDILKNYMYLFFRDDIISFNSSNLMISSDSDQRAFESKLKDKISANTLEVLQKIQSIMPSSDASVDTEPVRKINHKVEKLINEAMNPSNLALMNPVWHPWF